MAKGTKTGRKLPAKSAAGKTTKAAGSRGGVKKASSKAAKKAAKKAAPVKVPKKAVPAKVPKKAAPANGLKKPTPAKVPEQTVMRLAAKAVAAGKGPGPRKVLVALDSPLGSLESFHRNFVAQIRKHGFITTHLRAEDGPDFCYTTGFWLKFRFPEVLLFSLPPVQAHAILWHLHDMLAAGKRPTSGVPVSGVFRKARAVFLPMSMERYDEYLGCSMWFYGGDDFECSQLIFPDPDGHFPWDFGTCEEFQALQLDLTDGEWSGLEGR